MSSVVPVLDSHAHQSALLAGQLFACCAQMQWEVIGLSRLAADWYAVARRRPAKHLPLVTRIAAHYVEVAQKRVPEAVPTAMWLAREGESLLVRLRTLGGVPRLLASEGQAAFDEGFSLQWRRRPPMSRLARRQIGRDIQQNMQRQQPPAALRVTIITEDMALVDPAFPLEAPQRALAAWPLPPRPRSVRSSAATAAVPAGTSGTRGAAAGSGALAASPAPCHSVAGAGVPVR